MNPGVIDSSHKGPCSVYLKKVDDMFEDSASGPGWFKIWEDGYNADSGKWCVDTLIDNNGLLSVNLPTGLPTGYYLVRPELLALHSAHEGDPQFYHSCAQVFIEDGTDGTLSVPKDQLVSIPGYIQSDAPGLNFNLYEDDPESYEIPGPKVFIPKSTRSTKAEQKDGAIPSTCLLKNANWCAKAVPKHSDQDGCWKSVENCWAQNEKCWDTAPVTGGKGCDVWGDYCDMLNQRCEAGDYNGPAKFNGKEHFEPIPGGEIPDTYNNVFSETDEDLGNVGGGDENEDEEPKSKPVSTIKPEPTSTIVPEPTETQNQDRDQDQDQDQPDQPDQPGALKISEDGRCGGETGQTCKGSSFGDCCSKKGRCGRKTKQCTCGCQEGFGECRK